MEDRIDDEHQMEDRIDDKNNDIELQTKRTQLLATTEKHLKLCSHNFVFARN